MWFRSKLVVILLFLFSSPVFGQHVVGNSPFDFEVDTGGGEPWYEGTLVSVWDFNNSSFNDSYGTNHLTNSGVTFNGSTANFNGSAHLSISNANAGDFLIGDEDFTACAWIRHLVGTGDVIMAVSDPVGGSASQMSWGIRYDSDGTGRYWMSNNGTTAVTKVNPSSIDQTWVSICMSYDSSDDQILVSQNGGAAFTQTHTGGGFAASTADFTIGSYTNGSSGYNGLMDKVWFFNDSITDIQASSGVYVPGCHVQDLAFDEMVQCNP